MIVVYLVLALLLFIFVADFFSGPRLRREVVVVTREPDDKTIRGILLSRDRRWVRLTSPRFADGSEWIALEGDVTIPAANVAYIQVL